MIVPAGAEAFAADAPGRASSPAIAGRDSATAPAVRDTAAATRDTAAAAPAKSAAADDDSTVVRKPRWTEQPRVVMLRSLLVPGWGQLHNHAWLKAGAVAGVEGWLIGSIVNDQSKLDGLLSEVTRLRGGTDNVALERAINEYNDRLNQSVSGQWLLGGVLAYALVDAYVDAHFRTFETDFRIDPALPRDSAPDGTPSGSGKGTAARLSLRWHF